MAAFAILLATSELKMMCSMARKAASAIFRADVEDEEDEENLELETPKNSSNHATTKKSGNTKTIENHDTSPPLTIPPKVESVVNNSKMQLSDLNISAFSKMSIDTMASSMATNASSIGCSMTSITTPSSLQTAASNLNDDEAGLPVITLEEVKNHFMIEDAWTVIYDRVYNVTSFLAEHPGGIYVMEDHLGFDATVAFRSTGHSTDAFTMLNKYLIGILPKNERIYEDRIRW